MSFLDIFYFFSVFFFLFTKIKMFTSSKQSFIMYFKENLNSVQFSHSVMSDYLRPHESQHARPSCPSPIPWVHPDSCPLSQWCHLIICHPLLLLPSTFPSIRVFSNESALCIRWPKYGSLSFSISPSNELVKWVKLLSHVQLFCNPMDCSLPGFSVHGIFQARLLEWVAI